MQPCIAAYIYTILWVEVTICEEGTCWVQVFCLFSDETPAKTIDLHTCSNTRKKK